MKFKNESKLELNFHFAGVHYQMAPGDVAEFDDQFAHLVVPRGLPLSACSADEAAATSAEPAGAKAVESGKSDLKEVSADVRPIGPKSKKS